MSVTELCCKCSWAGHQQLTRALCFGSASSRAPGLRRLYWAHASVSATGFTVTSVSFQLPAKKGSLVWGFFSLRPHGGPPHERGPSAWRNWQHRAGLCIYTSLNTEIQFSWSFKRICRNLIYDWAIEHWGSWYLIWLCICVCFLSWGPPGQAVIQSRGQCLCLCLKNRAWQLQRGLHGGFVCVCCVDAVSDEGEVWCKFHLVAPVQNKHCNVCGSDLRSSLVCFPDDSPVGRSYSVSKHEGAFLCGSFTHSIVVLFEVFSHEHFVSCQEILWIKTEKWTTDYQIIEGYLRLHSPCIERF